MKKILQKITNKWIAWMSVLIFTASMLPIWYLAFYARPSGDDYGYSALTHAAWEDTHSLIEVFRAAAETVKINYIGWNGDWFTTFLFSLMPEVFVPYSFWIVPFIMTGAVIAATFYFMYEICVKVMDMPVADTLIYTSVILFAGYQFIPSTAIGMYWYVGAAHYMLPYAAGLVGIAWTSGFVRTGRLRYVAGVTACAFMVGGSSYFTSLLLFMVLAIVGGICCVKKKRRDAAWLLLPFLVCLVGFVIQCKSPGNTVRGGAEFGFDLPLAGYTVLESLRRGAVMIGEWLREKTLVFVLLFAAGVLGWETMGKVVEKRNWRFSFPLLFVILMYGFYSAMFAPEIYSEVFDSIEISLGPRTIQYFTFIMTAAFGIWYCEGWAARKWRESPHGEKFRSFMKEKYRTGLLFPVLALVCILILMNRGWLSDCVDKQVYEYVSSGQAEDFRAQIASQMEILLDDSIKEAYLVPINPEQGPLMHMPVTTDENAFTNSVVRNFYRKDKVVMIENK